MPWLMRMVLNGVGHGILDRSGLSILLQGPCRDGQEVRCNLRWTSSLEYTLFNDLLYRIRCGFEEIMVTLAWG